MKSHSRPQLSDAEPSLLNRVCVRPIEPAERTRFDQLIVDQHYLHAADLVGEQIRYIAECVEHARVKRCFLLDSYSTNPSAFSEGKNGKCLSD